ncbi:MAG: hypothetical protein GKS00_09805 [Alphaproteobacteria bacterium]|nr:hypothetical protein [Alphaproteobacteria bacterium]
MTADENGAENKEMQTAATTRRGLLKSRLNTGTSLDYLNLLMGEINNKNTRITVRYVPDKQILPPAAFMEYLASFGDVADEALESLAIAILDDINNEVVPRWVQIAAARTTAGQADHRVLIEDRQPKWDNPALLARLKRF